jgi:hypothetical protein
LKGGARNPLYPAFAMARGRRGNADDDDDGSLLVGPPASCRFTEDLDGKRSDHGDTHGAGRTNRLNIALCFVFCVYLGVSYKARGIGGAVAAGGDEDNGVGGGSSGTKRTSPALRAVDVTPELKSPSWGVRGNDDTEHAPPSKQQESQIAAAVLKQQLESEAVDAAAAPKKAGDATTATPIAAASATTMSTNAASSSATATATAAVTSPPLSPGATLTSDSTSAPVEPVGQIACAVNWGKNVHSWGEVVPPQHVCGKDRPICVGYLSGVHFGECRPGATPAATQPGAPAATTAAGSTPAATDGGEAGGDGTFKWEKGRRPSTWKSDGECCRDSSHMNRSYAVSLRSRTFARAGVCARAAGGGYVIVAKLFLVCAFCVK